MEPLTCVTLQGRKSSRFCIIYKRPLITSLQSIWLMFVLSINCLHKLCAKLKANFALCFPIPSIILKYGGPQCSNPDMCPNRNKQPLRQQRYLQSYSVLLAIVPILDRNEYKTMTDTRNSSAGTNITKQTYTNQVMKLSHPP